MTRMYQYSRSHVAAINQVAHALDLMLAVEVIDGGIEGYKLTTLDSEVVWDSHDFEATCKFLGERAILLSERRK